MKSKYVTVNKEYLNRLCDVSIDTEGYILYATRINNYRVLTKINDENKYDVKIVEPVTVDHKDNEWRVVHDEFTVTDETYLSVEIMQKIKMLKKKENVKNVGE